MNQKNKKPIPKTGNRKVVVKKKPENQGVNKQQLLMILLLMVVIFVAYAPSLNKQFINYDDDVYVIENPNIKNFSLSNVPSVFGNFYMAQYSPLPTMIYGTLYAVAGKGPLAYNLFAIALHLIATLLVFKFVSSLNANFRVAYLTAALFGLATMQVETVAWTAAIFKMGLYSIFFISSLISYVKYVKTGKYKFLALSLLLFLLSCLSKEQAVALSLAVIVTDLYLKRKILSRKVILEKIPFFLISAVFGILTILATKSNKDIIISSQFSFADRIIYACYALCSYIYKLFVPVNLSLFYPYPSLKNSFALYLLFPLIILILTGLFIWAVKKKNTFVLFGGLFFVVNMLFSLALQVITVREVVMADRYVYIASIGIFFMAAKGADLLIEKKRIKMPVLVAVAGIFLLLTGVFTYNRTFAWKNTNTIMTDAIEKYRFPLAYINRGFEYRQKKEYQKAIEDYTNALAVKPDYAMAYNNRGTVYFYMNQDSLAILDYNKALQYDQANSESWSNRGAALARGGKYEPALKDLDQAIKLDPTKSNSFTNRALTLEMLGRYDEAIADYYSCLKLQPNDAAVYNNIGIDRQRLNKFKESIEDFDRAISIDPQGEFYLTRSYSWNAMGDKAKAMADVQTAIKLGTKVDPRYMKMLQQ